MPDLSESHGRFWDDMLARGVEASASRAGASVEDGLIMVPMAGRLYSVDPGARAVMARDAGGEWTRADYLEAVVLVTYLATSDGFPLTGEWVSGNALPHGDAYFRPPHHMPTREIEVRFGNDPDGFVRACKAVGGVETDMADRGVELPALPRVPIRFNLWLGDDEFPGAEVRTLFDRSASHYLILDGILTLATITVRAILEAAEKAEGPE
jgi:hypothetical protein